MTQTVLHVGPRTWVKELRVTPRAETFKVPVQFLTNCRFSAKNHISYKLALFYEFHHSLITDEVTKIYQKWCPNPSFSICDSENLLLPWKGHVRCQLLCVPINVFKWFHQLDKNIVGPLMAPGRVFLKQLFSKIHHLKQI